MNDRRINDLVRMALEVEQFEQDVGAPHLHLVGAGPAPRAARPWFIGIGLAAAAGLAVVFALPALTHHEQPAPAHTTIATLPPKTNAVPTPAPAPAPAPAIARNTNTADPASVDQRDVNAAMNRIDPESVKLCIVMAIYRDAHGAMQCVQKGNLDGWSQNKRLSEVSPQDLKCAMIGQPCTPSANRALLVAMAGPRGSLPRNDQEATTIATCILGSPCENDSKCFAHAAAECVPSDVSVKIESTTYPR